MIGGSGAASTAGWPPPAPDAAACATTVNAAAAANATNIGTTLTVTFRVLNSTVPDPFPLATAVSDDECAGQLPRWRARRCRAMVAASPTFAAFHLVPFPCHADVAVR